MGLLDDAIREHLELKRRRGAEDAEIERLESEALGPAVSPPEAGATGEAAAYESEPAPEAPPEPYGEAPAAYEEAPPAPAEPAAAYEEPATGYHEAPADPYAPPPSPTPPDEHGIPEVDPAPSGATRAADPLDAGDELDLPVAGEPQATTEYDVEEELRSEQAGRDEPGEDDVLEETPEFLQETPEHDRLWFEQRPPRDFDFGG